MAVVAATVGAQAATEVATGRVRVRVRVRVRAATATAMVATVRASERV